MIDVAVIGAGPAGITAGIYAARAGLEVRVFERQFPGGQITGTHLMENYPGFPGGISGVEFGERLKKQAEEQGVHFVMADVLSIEQNNGYRLIRTAKETWDCKALIIAAGASPRKLGLPGEQAFTGTGISYCATCDGTFFKERVVCVVGGGDTALEDALYLSNVAKKVYLIHRRQEFRAQKMLVDRAKQCRRIEFLLNKVPVAFRGEEGALQEVVLRDKHTEEQSCIQVDGCFLAIGYVPNTACVKDVVMLDNHGYVVAGEDTKTGAKGIFTAGDIRTKKIRQVVTAVADGAAAALAAREYIEENL